MATYYCNVAIVSRKAGRSVVAAAAYRAGERLYDERLHASHDYTDKSGVLHSAVLLPAGAPDRLADRERLWNEVEAGERRKDAQLARQVEFALPRELSEAANIELARSLVQEAFVDCGMVADLAVHDGRARDGGRQPHAHVLLTMRDVGSGGFGAKRPEWNDRGLVNGWRELLATRTNEALARAGSGARVDHRSYAERGLPIEPRVKVGPGAGARRGHDSEAARREAENLEIGARNAERIARDPGFALEMLTEHHSTFTRQDVARLVSAHTDDGDLFARVMARVEAHPGLVRLGADRLGRERLTTCSMLATEARMAADAARLGARGGHGGEAVAAARAEAGARLGKEQAAALAHVTRAGDLSLVVGFAGTGKSTMLGAAREVWESAGYRVRGAALSGIAAEGLQGGSGIESRTIASLEHAWARDRDRLGPGDVLVVDEAGMVGSRQMGRVLAEAEGAGAKVVLVGDPAQLQAIDAGAAFRALVAEHGAARLTEVRRQHEAWQRVATQELATGQTGRALRRYAGAGAIHATGTRDEAREALVARWDADRRGDPSRTSAILAATRAEVAELNDLARARVRASGDLEGEDVAVRTERGTRTVAAGERVMFLRNDRGLEVRNGTLGTVRAVGADGAGLTVQLDGPAGVGTGRLVSFDTRDYAHLEHGYAATVHKSQGITVDRAHVLATPTMDRGMAYVALSRQRERVEVTYAEKDFKDLDALAAGLARDRTKDTTLDYARDRPAADAADAGPAGTGAAPARDEAAFAAARDAMAGAMATAARDMAGTTRREAAPEARPDGPGRAAPATSTAPAAGMGRELGARMLQAIGRIREENRERDERLDRERARSRGGRGM